MIHVVNGNVGGETNSIIKLRFSRFEIIEIFIF